MVAVRLKELRAEKGLKQKEVAEQLGISTSCYGGYEQGAHSPDHAILIKIASFFDVSVDYLIGRTDEFGTSTAVPMGNAMGESYSAEERELIVKYRKLSPDLKEMLNGILGTWTGGTASTTQPKFKNKA